MSRSFLILGVVLALLLGGGWYAYIAGQQARIAAMTTELHSFLIPSVVAGDQTYVIDENFGAELELSEQKRILETARYAVEQRIQPLFALPGVDLGAFENSVAALADSQTSIAALYEPSISERIAAALYPVDYLQHMGELEELRRKLTTEPSAELVDLYHQQLLRTIDAYDSYISLFLETLPHIDTRDMSTHQIRFSTGYSSAEYFRGIFEEYRNAAATQRAKAVARFECYIGTVSSCIPLTLPDELVRGTALSTVPTPVPEVIEENLAFMNSFRENSIITGEFYSKKAAMLGQSSCFLPYAPVYYQVWWRQWTDGTRVFRPGILNDVVFYDFIDGFFSRVAYAKEYVARGGPRYVHQSIANHYMCPDLAADMSALLNIMYVYEHLPKLKYTGSDSQLSTLIDRLEKIRATIEKEPILQEGIVSQYMGIIRQLLTAYDQTHLQSELPTVDVLALEDLLLTYTYGTASYDEMLTQVVANNYAVFDYAVGDTRIDAKSLFYLRSVPKVTLGGFNKSILPVDIPFVKNPDADLPAHYISLSKLRNEYSTVELTEMLHDADRVVVELGVESGTVDPEILKTGQ